MWNTNENNPETTILIGERTYTTEILSQEVIKNYARENSIGAFNLTCEGENISPVNLQNYIGKTLRIEPLNKAA